MIRKRIGTIFAVAAMFLSTIAIAGTNFNVNADSIVTNITTEAGLKSITGAGIYKLSNDIALSGNWTPISNFTGTLDGNGYVISKLNIASTANAGFFAATNGATIKNLGIKATSITGTASAAVFVGNSTATTLKNCYGILSGTITGGTAGKELLGNVDNSTLTNCYYNTGDINALNTNKNDDYVQWVGSATVPTLKAFYEPATVDGKTGSPYSIKNADDLTNLAGLVNNGILTYSAAKYQLNNDILANDDIISIGDGTHPFTGDFNGNGYTIKGTITNGGSYAGLFGNTDGSAIEKLGVNINVKGTENVGGLIGNAKDGTISQCYSAGTITGTANAGGLVGTAANTIINNSYTTGTVSGGTSLGGLTGYSTDVKFTNCYTTSNNFAGGTTATCVNCYSVGTATSVSGLTTKTLAQMKDGSLIFSLNGTNTASPLFGGKIGYTPVLTGIGEGKGIGVPCKVTITQAQTDNGTIKVMNNSTEVKSGDYVDKNTTLTIQSTPKTGYELTSIKVGSTSLLANSFVITADVTIEPTFTKIETYTIKVTKNDGGKVTPSDDNVLVRKGSSQAFTITANTGYKIDSVTFSGSGLTVSGDTYTTAVLTKDETLTVKFISLTDGVKEVSSTSDGVVVTVKGIENVIGQIPSNIGNTIKVPMDKNTVIDDKTLAALQGKNVTLILDMGTYSWRINGLDIVANPTSVNLGVTVGTGVKAIDEKYMSKFSKFTDKTQVDLAYSGAFPFNATLTIKAPGNNVGRYANLFYFNETTNAFEVADSCKIASDGTATFKFKHASRYVVAVADKALALQDLSAGAFTIDISNPLEKMDTTQLVFATALLLLVIAGGVTLLLIVRKNN